MTAQVWPNSVTQGVYAAIKRNRQQYAKWLEWRDCLAIIEDLPEYREAYEVPSDYGRDLARAYILAEAMEAYYCDELRPEVGPPYDSVLSEGLNDVDFMHIAQMILQGV